MGTALRHLLLSVAAPGLTAGPTGALDRRSGAAGDLLTHRHGAERLTTSRTSATEDGARPGRAD